MYTIKEAATRSGVSVPLLRAWERRYGVVAPVRTAAGYRLYDEDALRRLRSMRSLVSDGWQPSAAAAAILAGTAPEPTDAPDGDGEAIRVGPADQAGSPGPFLAAAAALDAAAIERALDEMFAAGSFEFVAERRLLPALAALGEAWADGRVSVAGEHAASHAVHRRLAAAFEAAGRPPSARGIIAVGLPPGSHHELGALAFAVAARRASLPVLYLGPDLPVADWIATAVGTRARAAVVATPTSRDVDSASRVVDALVVEVPSVLVAVGGNGAAAVAERSPSVLSLPPSLVAAVDALRDAIGRRPSRSR